MTDAQSMPNSKGPARVTMPIESQPVSATEVSPEDAARLTLEYRDGQPVIIAGGGNAFPARLKAVDASGAPLKVAAAIEPRNAYGSFHTGDSHIVLDACKPRPDSDKPSYNVDFWLGTYTS